MSDEEKAVAIGDCRGEDLPEISKILAESPEAAMWSEDSLGKMIGSGFESFLVARRDEELAGFVLSRMVGGEAEILNLAVKKGHRRRGVGAALVNAMQTRCEERGCGRVILEVRESNRGAIKFYEGMGFERVGRRAGYYQDPEEAALVLAKAIPPEG